MKLIDFLKLHGLTDHQFALRLGNGVTPRAVKKWKYGETRPRLPEVARIEIETGGEVRLSDFIDVLGSREGDAA